jgi:hypothetical protein
MESPTKGKKTMKKDVDIMITEIFPVHTLTECGKVTYCYSLGEKTALKVLKAGSHSFALLGLFDAPIDPSSSSTTCCLILSPWRAHFSLLWAQFK